MARYEIIEARSGEVLARHRTRTAALDGWRIDHAGLEIRIDRVYRDAARRLMVEGTWHFADDVHDSAPVPAPGPVPRPVEELLEALRRVAGLVDGPLTSAAYHRLRERSDPAARTVGERFGTWAGALEAAGLPPTGFGSSRHHGQRRRWSDADILEAVAGWIDQSGDRRFSTYAAAARENSKLPATDLIARRFGGWRKVLAAIDTTVSRPVVG